MKDFTKTDKDWHRNAPVRLTKKHNGQCPETKKEMMAKRKQALTFASRAAKETGSIMSVYKCPFCRYWHITSQDQY